VNSKSRRSRNAIVRCFLSGEPGPKIITLLLLARRAGVHGDEVDVDRCVAATVTMAMAIAVLGIGIGLPTGHTRDQRQVRRTAPPRKKTRGRRGRPSSRKSSTPSRRDASRSCRPGRSYLSRHVIACIASVPRHSRACSSFVFVVVVVALVGVTVTVARVVTTCDRAALTCIENALRTSFRAKSHALLPRLRQLYVPGIYSESPVRSYVSLSFSHSFSLSFSLSLCRSLVHSLARCLYLIVYFESGV